MEAVVNDALAEVLKGRRAANLESVTLDFKTVGRSVGDTLKDLAEAAMCFANSQGGFIVVGVRDDASGQAAFVGSSLDPTRTVGRIYELTEPGLIVIAEAIDYVGTTLTLITVPRSPDIHQVDGRATERIATSCRSMSATRIGIVLSDRRGDDWSAKDSGEPLETVSPVAEAIARELLGQAPDAERASWARLPWPDVCRRLGVASDGTSPTAAPCCSPMPDEPTPNTSAGQRTPACSRPTTPSAAPV